MKLTQEQESAVADWVRAGGTVSDVQKRLEDEFALRLTYMDVRFLIDDLDLELPDTPAYTPAPDPTATTEAAAAPGKVSVSIDKITRPGALVSGGVTFSDGQRAQWSLDQMGRLALNASQPDYKPSKEDLADFQRELQTAIEEKGNFY